MHTQEEKKKEEEKRNSISMVWRKSKVVKLTKVEFTGKLEINATANKNISN